MGSYGIGVERIIASHIEQNHDENGIIWNGEIAPFKVILINITTQSKEITDFCESLYKELTDKNFDVLYDDRDDLRPGFKFKDADLIGIPYHIIVGEKNFKNGNLEFKVRKTGERSIIAKDDIMSNLNTLLNA